MDTKSKAYGYFTMALCTVLFATFITIIAGAAVPIPTNDTSEALQYIQNIKPQKIIVDVDLGVDDALGLLLALAKEQPEYPEVIAITCTQGNTNVVQVAINALKTLRMLKKKIPVYIGAYASLTTTPKSDSFYGKDGFGDVPDPDPPSLIEAETEHAAAAMVRLVAAHPGKISVVALGPLTNIALAIRLDPTFRQNLKGLYWMGGSIEGIGNIKPGIEFNAFMDPEANFIAFNTTGPPIVLLSWESCIYHGTVTKDWRQNVLANVDSPTVKFLNSIEAQSLNKTNKWSVCDAKMMAIILDPTIATKSSILHIDTSYQGDARGALMVDYKNQIRPRNSVIIQEIDTEKFKAMCLNNLS